MIKIRKDMNRYTLSINLSKGAEEKVAGLPQIGNMGDFRYISNQELGRWYKLDVGFQLPESDIDMRIL